MFRYIMKRTLMMIPVILGISLIIFSIMELSPGDPVTLMLGDGASEQAIAELREQMGLNDHFFIKYIRYVKNAAMGDFGISYRNKVPVINEIASRFPTTLNLTFWGVALSVLIGIPVGVISAIKQYTIIDSLSLFSALILTAMPAFWLGLMLILFFSLKLNLLPATGIETWRHFIMPSITLAAASMATIIRMTRSTMLEVIRQDYIRTAKAKGASEFRIVYKHALRNALLPIVTVVGLNFGTQLGGAIVTESVFAMPGIGTLMVAAVRTKDTPIVMASVLFAALLAGIINLLVDVLYVYIDPRLKSEYVKSK
ncbi:MAG: ABC transporter permease [Negativicutes bacterium]